MTQAHRVFAYPDVQSAEVQRSIETRARRELSEIRTFHQRARDNIRGSSVGTAFRRSSGGSPEAARIDKSLPNMTDWFGGADLFGGMTAAARFDSGVSSHQDERCWVEWRQVVKPVAMPMQRNSNSN